MELLLDSIRWCPCGITFIESVSWGPYRDLNFTCPFCGQQTQSVPESGER